MFAYGDSQDCVAGQGAIRLYMREHFEHEEAHMESISFADREEHKAMHESIVIEMNDMLKVSKDYLQPVKIRPHSLPKCAVSKIICT